MQKEPLVAVIIVTWNNQNDVIDCLTSILDQDYKNYKVILADNASSDDTFKIVQEHLSGEALAKREFPQVDLVQTGANRYFAGGNNYGFDYAKEKYSPDYYLVLNPDTKVEQNLISALVHVAQTDDRIGIINPKVKFWNNANAGLINSAGLIYDGFMQCYDRGYLEEDKGQYDSQAEISAATGTCMLIPAKVIEQTGGFWESLKMYLEDLEFSLRVKNFGWKLVYSPVTTVHHKYMQSTNQNKQHNINKRKMYHFLLIALRHYPVVSKLAMIKHYIKFRLGYGQV